MNSVNTPYGTNTAQVEAYLNLLPTLTDAQWAAARAAARVTALGAARDTARAAARAAARSAGRDAAQAAAWYAAWADARAAARGAEALVVRDLISDEHFDILTAPMRAAGIDFDALTNVEIRRQP